MLYYYIWYLFKENRVGFTLCNVREIAMQLYANKCNLPVLNLLNFQRKEPVVHLKFHAAILFCYIGTNCNF